MELKINNSKLILILLLINSLSMTLASCSRSVTDNIEYRNQKVKIKKLIDTDGIEVDNTTILNESYNKEEVKIIDHEFIDGDSLESISKKYYKTTKEIINFNQIVYPYHLEPFQIIRIKCNKTDLCYNDRKQDIYLVTPLQGRIIKKFYDQRDRHNFGALVFASPNGTVIRSSMNGKVIYKGYSNQFGNIIIIEQEGFQLAYGYMKTILVKVGDRIRQRQKIGFVGNMPHSNNSGLYMSLRKNNQPVDPEQYFQ